MHNILIGVVELTLFVANKKEPGHLCWTADNLRVLGYTRVLAVACWVADGIALKAFNWSKPPQVWSQGLTVKSKKTIRIVHSEKRASRH